jgi:GntP family gluconate:H+ symporter
MTIRRYGVEAGKGAGELTFSHANNGGFWLVKKYFNMTVGQTMKTWSVSETIISVTALSFTAVTWHFA